MSHISANETSEEFSSRLFDMISGGFTGLSIALGIKSGLFDVLVAHHGNPMTSQELADAAELKERYVREWLGVMTTAHIVDLDKTSSSEKYQLPAHRLDSFRPGTLSSQVTASSKGIPLWSGVFGKMLEIMKKDGPRGHDPSTIEPFHEFEKDYSLPWYNHCFAQEFIPSNPEIQTKLESGIRTLDIGCGCGEATQILAQHFPESHFVGLDISQSNVDTANGEAARLGLKNLEYVCADATKMSPDWTSTFDYVFIFNVLHDIPRPDLVIDEVKRVLKKDGVMTVVEFDFGSKIADNVGHVASPFIYTISLFYCLPQSYQYVDSHGLGTVWGRERIEEFLEGKGFVVKSVTKTPHLNEIHFLCHLA